MDNLKLSARGDLRHRRLQRQLALNRHFGRHFLHDRIDGLAVLGARVVNVRRRIGSADASAVNRLAVLFEPLADGEHAVFLHFRDRAIRVEIDEKEQVPAAGDDGREVADELLVGHHHRRIKFLHPVVAVGL